MASNIRMYKCWECSRCLTRLQTQHSSNFVHVTRSNKSCSSVPVRAWSEAEQHHTFLQEQSSPPAWQHADYSIKCCFCSGSDELLKESQERFPALTGAGGVLLVAGWVEGEGWKNQVSLQAGRKTGKFNKPIKIEWPPTLSCVCFPFPRAPTSNSKLKIQVKASGSWGSKKSHSACFGIFWSECLRKEPSLLQTTQTDNVTDFNFIFAVLRSCLSSPHSVLRAPIAQTFITYYKHRIRNICGRKSSTNW